MTETLDSAKSDGGTHTRTMIVRSSAAIVALMAVRSTYALWSDNVAACGNTSFWLLTVMEASPMVLMFLSVWLVAFAPTEQERTIWLVFLGVVTVSYFLAFLAAGAMVVESISFIAHESC